MPLQEKSHIVPKLSPWLISHGLRQTVTLSGKETTGYATGVVDACTTHGKDKSMGSILEIKGAERSLAFALRQAALYGSGVAMRQLADGVAASEICVPVAATNGWFMQFGATYVLAPSLPVFLPVSKAFDLMDAEDNKQAMLYFDRFRAIGGTEPVCNVDVAGPNEMVLDLDQKFWAKRLTPEVLNRGLGLFSRSDATDIRVAEGLAHMIPCLNALYEHDVARQVVVFPVCVISAGVQEVATAADLEWLLVYPDMTAQGFRVGIPDHDSDIFEAYVRAVENAVDAVHAAGVVHLDLYVSNIMHRITNDNVEIRIVDWDAAHLIGARPGSAHVEANLRGGHPRKRTVVSEQHDRDYVAALWKTGNPSIWARMAVGSPKSEMDKAFFELLDESTP
mmetsp:Transcript_17988/g.36259  ORF Transcript_17988/g.36259 Transcript_17988/m.36259 type:complete len:393 (+) Transcript_17988:394-1572(+)